MTLQKVLRFVLVLSVVLGSASHAFAQATPDPSGPLKVKTKLLTGTNLPKPPHSVLVEGHAFRTDGQKLFWREVTYVFGANDTTGEASEFEVIPFTVPTTAGTPSDEEYVRPVLMQGFVYARAKESAALAQSQQQVQDRFNRVEGFLNISGALLEEKEGDQESLGFLSRSDREFVAEYLRSQSVFLEIERDRAREDQDRLSRVPEITREMMMAQKKSGFGLFRLIMGIVIDGGVPGTDIVMYIETVMHDFGDGAGPVETKLVHIVLTDGELAEIFETKASTAPDSSMQSKPNASSNYNYTRYAIRTSGTQTPVLMQIPTDFCKYVHEPANNAKYLCEVVNLACDVFEETTGESANFPCTGCEHDQE